MNGCRPVAMASPRRWRAVAVAVLMALVVLLGLVLRPSSAARLTLNPARMTTVSVADRCTDSVAATDGEAVAGEVTTVKLTGLGSACAGQELALTLFGGDGAALTSTTTALAAELDDSATVIVPAYTPADVAGAAVTLGTWGVPATWTSVPPVTVPLVTCTVLNDPTGTKTCEATNVRIESWGYPTVNTYNFYTTITSPSQTQDVEWQLTINLADPAFEVDTKLADSNNGVTLAPGWSCSAMPTLELRGRGDTNTQYVGGGSTVTVWMLGRAAEGLVPGGTLFNCS